MGRPAEDFLLRKYPNSSFWYYRLKGWSSFKSTGQKTKAAAKAFALAEWMLREESGIQKANCLFKEFTTGFFFWDSPWCSRQRQKGKIQETTAKWRQSFLTHHIEPRFNKMVLSSITPGMIDSWLFSLKLSSQTKEHIVTTLRIIFREAVRERYISFNPMDYVDGVKVVHSHNEPPTMEELKKLFPQDMELFKNIWPLHHYGVMCALMASTGLHMQEVRALTPKSISIEKHGIIVARAVKTTGEIGLPKADEIRVVLAPSETIRLLKWWINFSEVDQDDLLFPGRSGGPIDRKAPYKYFMKALKTAEIKVGERKLTVHGLRHAYNTRMRQILTEAAIEGFWDETQMCFANKLKSADQILREYTGHRSERMTDLYDHPDLVKKIDAFQAFMPYTELFWVE